jgi:dTMP kinase
VERIDTDPAEAAGIFITLEGPDGAGKSTQQALLEERVRALGREVVATREPGGTVLGERVRGILLERAADYDALIDALLFNAARRALVRDVIRPALDRGAVVVCDRFADSTLAYQGFGAGAPLDVLSRIAEIATDGMRPSRTVLLDIAVEDGLNRRRGGPVDEMTRFETDSAFDTAFHERVRGGFRMLAEADADRWRVVDASQSADEVATAVWEAVEDLF